MSLPQIIFIRTKKMKLLNPETIEQAAELMQQGFVPVSGGTDLIVRRHALSLKPVSGSGPVPGVFSCLNIEGTNSISVKDGRINIGSSMSLADIIEHQGCPELLRKALASIAAPGIRNAATLAGNICNASPAADSLPALYVLNAEITASRPGLSRRIAIEDFITGPGKNALEADELVTSISCDSDISNNAQTIDFFQKVGTRAANALSKLSVAAIYSLTSENGKQSEIADFRLAVGACAPTVIRSKEAEKIIIAALNKNSGFDDAVKIYESLLKPIDDQRSTAEYRRNTALRIIKNLLTEINGQHSEINGRAAGGETK